MLQVRYVSAAGEIVKAGGPTVKNVSGFDLCRLLVGSRGTLGFLGDVILRTRPLARCSRVVPRSTSSREAVLGALYRPVSVLWDETTTWVLLEGDERDVEAEAAAARPVDGRWSAGAPDGSEVRRSRLGRSSG